MRGSESERGAALLAVLAMVVLLASFATLGLSRLKAAGERISEAQTLSEAQLLAGTGTTAAVSVISKASWLGSTLLMESMFTKRLTQCWSEMDTRDRLTK